MVAFGSRSASSVVQQQRRLHNQHAIPPRASERAPRRDRARAQRPAADQPAPFDPALLGTAVHPDACGPAVHSSTPEHSAHGAASWLREDEVASRAVQVPLAKANRPVLDARSLARRTELRRACSARGIDYSICDELHELEDRLAGGEAVQQGASAAEGRLAGGEAAQQGASASEYRLAGGGSAQHGASASAALAQHAPGSTPKPSAQLLRAQQIAESGIDWSEDERYALKTAFDPNNEDGEYGAIFDDAGRIFKIARELFVVPRRIGNYYGTGYISLESPLLDELP